MVQYTLVESPEVILTVPGKDSTKAREKAMDQLVELMDSGQLPTDLPNGFSPQQFIEVKLPNDEPTDAEDAVTQAVQVLSNFATLKLKRQELQTTALEVRKQIDVLFTDTPVSEDEITRLKDGFKILKTFAQANCRYHEVKAQAEQARTLIDQALQAPATESKSTKNGK
jgi:LPS O-antigen subunit length determinant protein (WzzB/FepE family)